MKRRTFIAGLGSTAVWPAVARAQQDGGCGASAFSSHVIPAGTR